MSLCPYSEDAYPRYEKYSVNWKGAVHAFKTTKISYLFTQGFEVW